MGSYHDSQERNYADLSESTATRVAGVHHRRRRCHARRHCAIGRSAELVSDSGSTGGEGIAEFGGVIYGFGDHRQTMMAQRRYVRK